MPDSDVILRIFIIWISIDMGHRCSQPSVLPGLSKPVLHCAVLLPNGLSLVQSLVPQRHQTIIEILKSRKNKPTVRQSHCRQTIYNLILMASGSLLSMPLRNQGTCSGQQFPTIIDSVFQWIETPDQKIGDTKIIIVQ